MTPYTHPGVAKQVATIDNLAAIAFKLTRTEEKAVRGKTRIKQVAFARHLIMWACRRYTKLSYPDIGFYFLKDHVSVIHAYKKIETLRFLKDKEYIRIIKEYDAILKPKFIQYYEK